jgi:hypothetical protein
MLLEAKLTVVHVPGVTVSDARRCMVGGEQKSDPKDAGVIADELRLRRVRPAVVAFAVAVVLVIGAIVAELVGLHRPAAHRFHRGFCRCSSCGRSRRGRSLIGQGKQLSARDVASLADRISTVSDEVMALARDLRAEGDGPAGTCSS